MKKVILLIILLFLCGSVAGCQKNNIQNKKTEQREKYLIKKEISGEYKIQIFDKNGEIIKDDVLWKEPTVIMINEHLLYYTEQTGTGLSTQIGFFYDYNTGMQSEEYMWVLDYTDTRVALGYPDKVVVRNIFNDNYYVELVDFQYSLADVADSILEAKFSPNNDVITVTYVTRDDYTVVSQDWTLP